MTGETQNSELRTQNAERRTPNAELRMLKVGDEGGSSLVLRPCFFFLLPCELSADGAARVQRRVKVHVEASWIGVKCLRIGR